MQGERALKYHSSKSPRTASEAKTLRVPLYRRTLALLVISCATLILSSGSTLSSDSRYTAQKKTDQACMQTRSRATAYGAARSQSRHGQHAQTYRTNQARLALTAVREARLSRHRQVVANRQAAAAANQQRHLIRVHQFQARVKAARTVQVQAQVVRNHQRRNLPASK
jgi:hypothetical protein